ncbi:MAG: hypothetical protein AAGJ37_12485 [Pseudomonadota bacterium]
MNYFLISAAFLSFIVGAVHSFLGEKLIFKKLRNKSIVPELPAAPLKPRNIQIIWATWHLASIFGVSMGIVLLHLSTSESISLWVIQPIAWAMFLSGLLVLIATKGRHPGWIGLCGVAFFCWLS